MFQILFLKEKELMIRDEKLGCQEASRDETIGSRTRDKTNHTTQIQKTLQFFPPVINR
jgi:hypothetical protein